jgi:hypothetical protein
MFNQFPKLAAPITVYTHADTTISGTISSTSGTSYVYGTSTQFLLDIVVGDELYVTIDGVFTKIGHVAKIMSNTILRIDSPCQHTITEQSATARTFRPTQYDNIHIITDFIRRVKVIERYTNSISILMPYTVTEGETPEIVSMKFYNTPYYHWTILLANNIINPREEWPVSEIQLLEKISLKYPDNSKDDIYEYRDIDTGYVVDTIDPVPENYYPVTIYEYESELNESKRSVKIIDPAFIRDFVTEFFAELNTTV